MASIQNISDLVESFVSGKLPFLEFANKFAPIFKSALKSDPDVRMVALAVHAEISHHYHGLISQDELESRLAPYGSVLNEPVVSYFYPAPVAPPNPIQAFAPDSKGELVPV
jgi:hypothetical protein